MVWNIKILQLKIASVKNLNLHIFTKYHPVIGQALCQVLEGGNEDSSRAAPTQGSVKLKRKVRKHTHTVRGRKIKTKTDPKNTASSFRVVQRQSGWELWSLESPICHSQWALWVESALPPGGWRQVIGLVGQMSPGARRRVWGCLEMANCSLECRACWLACQARELLTRKWSCHVFLLHSTFLAGVFVLNTFKGRMTDITEKWTSHIAGWNFPEWLHPCNWHLVQ